MKLKFWTLIFLLALATMARAATNDLTGLLQKGLFEEEANRDLTAAIANYQSLTNAFDKDRQLAATAIFRLGECYRKLGKTNEAVVQYERILHDFNDQQTLVTLSQQNLTGLRQRGTVGSETLAELDNLRAALARTQADVARIDALPAANRTVGIASMYGNDKNIQTLSQELQSLRQKEAALLTRYLPENSQVKDVSKQVQAAEEALKIRTDNLTAAAHASLDAAEEAYRQKVAEVTSGSSSSGVAANSSQTAQLKSLGAAQRAELAQNESLLKTLQSMNKEDLRKALPGIFPDNQLDTLENRLTEAKQNLVQLKIQYGPDHPRYHNAEDLIKTIEQQIDDRIDGIMLGTQAKIDSEKSYLANIEGATPSTGTSGGGGSSESPTTDEEQQEIRRIQAMIQNSPDLINAPGQGVHGSDTPLLVAASKGQLIVAKYLLDHGADVNGFSANHGSTALCTAAENGHKAMVELLLAHGADVSAGGLNPLFLAVSRGYTGVAQVLLAHKADVNKPSGTDTSGQRPVHVAARDNRTDLLQVLLNNKADVNVTDKDGHTPLELAAMANATAAAKLLLDLKAATETKDIYGNTPLCEAADRGNTDMVSLLLNSGAAVDATNSHNATPLLLAVAKGHADAARVLLEHKADPDHRGTLPQFRPYPWIAQQDWNKQPVTFAIMITNTEILKLVLDAGANPEGDSSLVEASPLFYAIDKNYVDGLQLLLQHGANANRPSTNGIPPLTMIVSRRADKRMVPLLLDKGADPNAESRQYYPPLFYTSDPEIGRWLLDHKADVNLQTASGLTALMNASETNFVKFLLENGAKTDLQQTNGNTALHYAAGTYSSSPEKVALLLEHKANPNIQNEVGNTPLDIAQAGVSGQIPYTLLQAHAGGIAPAKVSPDNEQKIVELLTQAGGLANLPKRNQIEVRRGVNTAFTMYKDSQGRNRYSLLEVIAASYNFLTQHTSGRWLHDAPFRAQMFGGIESPIRFPDFKKVVIYRRTENSAKQTPINVDLDKILNTANCSQDTMLEWGDVVEIPEADHPVDLNWPGLSDEIVTTFTNCTSREVTIKIKDESTTLKLAASFHDPGNGPCQSTHASFMLRSVLDNSKLIRVSSDLSRVKVTRTDPATKKTTEWIVDCTNPKESDIWLRDGDVIEVPEK
jgi:ankyrin repeat protein